MKNIRVKDERIVQMQNMVLGEAYIIVVLLLFISVFVKAYVMKLDYSSYIGEIGIIVLSIIYAAIRSAAMGNNLIDTSKRNKVLWIIGALIASVVITAVNGLKNYTNYGEQYSGIFDLHFLAVLAVTFLSSLVLISVGLLFIYLCHKKGQQNINKTLSDNDSEDN